MKDLSVKQNVLQEIMDLMDEKEGESLKSHPKLMAKPKVTEPEGEVIEELSPEAKVKEDEEEISPEMLQALLEKFKGLK